MLLNHFRRLLREASLTLREFNPFYIYREEKRLDREANILIAMEFASAIRENSSVANKSLEIVNKFISTFEVHSEPEHRVVRSEDEIAEYMKEYGMKKEDFDSEENPFMPLF